MRHVSILVAKDQLPNLLSYAGSKKLFHLTDVEDNGLPEGAQRYEPMELMAKASTIKNRITTLTTTLSIEDMEGERLRVPVDNLDELAKFLDEQTLRLEHEVRQLEDEQGKLQTEKEQTAELSRFLSGLENVGVSLDGIAGSGFLTNLAGEASTESIGSVQRELDQITYGNLIFAITNTSEKNQTFLAMFPSAFQEDAKQAVTALGAKLGPPWTGFPTDPKKAKEAIDQKLFDLESSLKGLEEKKTRLATEEGPRIKSLTMISEILDARTKAVAGSSSTEATVLLQAWVPERSTKAVGEDLSKACDGLASMYIENNVENKHSSSEESSQPNLSHPPTSISAPGWTKPLQGIIDNFGIPSYRETNPLPFMILTFPLIFGMMFGDIGGGLIFLGFGLYLYYLKKKNAKVGDISRLFVTGAELVIMLGIGTIIAGFVFGDIFGLESFTVLGVRPVFSPVEGVFASPPQMGNLLLYMEFILLFGVAHYLSGLGINAYNKIRNKEYRHALLGPISWAIFYASFIYAAILVVTSNFKFTTLLDNPIVLALVFIPLGLMGYGEGGLHVMEAFIGAGSNTLSYLRIWALNLADYSVKFAFFTSFGIGGAIAGNALVLTLEGLIVFVQTLRLHWVEWFGKFYEGTGHSFAPYQEPMGWIVPN